VTDAFSFDYDPGAIHYGRERAADLSTILDERGLDSAVIVCGSNTGSNRDLMEPIEAGLGERHVGTFDETTPEKRAATAVAAAERADELGADTFLPVGGGSSLDVATVATVVRADGRTLGDVRETVRETGGIALPDDTDALTPLVPVPTTLAGADLSVVAGITVELDSETVATGVGDRALMPSDLVYDPALFETTPRGVLAGSAMNGFDKAIESLYAANRTPITDATAARAVGLLAESLPALFDDDAATGYDSAAMNRAVEGIVLAQYGISRPGDTTLNVLHAFGHALRDVFGLQQGIAHAVIAPAALSDMFDTGVDSATLRSAFDVPDEASVIRQVETIRSALDLPTRLRDVVSHEGDVSDETVQSVLAEAAAATAADSLTDNTPENYELTQAAAERVLTAAW
jgi:alcohol dehydrogenase class IV